MRVYQRKDKKHWYIDYTDPYGVRHREKVVGTKEEAQATLGAIAKAKHEGRYFDMMKKKERVPFDDFANEFLELYKGPTKKPSVLKRYKGLIKRLSPNFSGKCLSEITVAMVEKHKAERAKIAAPATVNRELACLKCMFNRAIALDKITDNPVRKVKLFKENNQRRRFLSKEEVAKLIDVCSPNLKPIVITAVYTGMRKGELLNLKWENIDLQHNMIYLLHTKNGERREVPMAPIVKKALSELPKRSSKSFIFRNRNGKQYRDVRKSFDEALKKCGIIDHVIFHDLRRTTASHLVMAGVPLKTVQDILGHKTSDMINRYAYLSPEYKRSAVEILEQQLGTKLAQNAVEQNNNQKQVLAQQVEEQPVITIKLA